MPKEADFEYFLATHDPIDCNGSFNAGDLFGEWRITVFLGKGGSGEVYRVEHIQNGMPAALKVHIPHVDSSDSRRAASVARFKREARLLSQNRHLAFPRFFNFGEAHHHCYFVMELLEPITLPTKDKAVADFLLRLCDGVQVLHRLGLVHRDIKPQNILCRQGKDSAELLPVLIDFGLVKEIDETLGQSGAAFSIVDGQAVGVGTPRYAAPEQFSGDAISKTADIHALGMLVNECFSDHLPPVWERIVNRSTSSISSRRFRDVSAFAHAIRWRHFARRTFRVVSGIVLFSSIAFAVSTWWRISGRETMAWDTLCENVTTNSVTELPLWEKCITNKIDNVVINIVPIERAFQKVTTTADVIVVHLKKDVANVFTQPISLKQGREYRIVGPGILDAALEGNATLRLKNCVFLNRTPQPLAKAGIYYILEGGVYLNFTALSEEDRDRFLYTDRFRYINRFDAAYNTLRFHGPETLRELTREQTLEAYEMLHRENEP
ncbi:MAG: serine/threonine-protein kinase [Kiritimatiellia bacterium]